MTLKESLEVLKGLENHTWYQVANEKCIHCVPNECTYILLCQFGTEGNYSIRILITDENQDEPLIKEDYLMETIEYKELLPFYRKYSVTPEVAYKVSA